MEVEEEDGGSPLPIRRLERKHEPKKWVQLYTNTVRNKLELRNFKIQQRREDRMRMFRTDDDEDDASVYTMATISMRTDNNRAFLTTGSPKKKVLPKIASSSSPLGKKAASSSILSEKPPTLPVWHSHWGNQLLCYLCSQPALHSSVSCGSCNNIAHTRCVQEIARENRDCLSYCMQCLEQFYADRADYNERRRQYKEELIRHHCATIIARRIRAFIERRRFINKQRAVRKLQAITRGLIYAQRYYRQMRGKLRLILLQVTPDYFPLENTSTDFLNNVLITVTVYDSHKNAQYFRMERSYHALSDKAITLPGVNFFMTVIFTVAVRDETKSYCILGQTQLSLGDIVYPAQPSEVTLHVSPRVMWMPQEGFGIKYAHLVTTGRINHVMRHFRENVSFQVRYLPQNPVTTSCQYIHGPPLDVLRRGGDMGGGGNRGAPKHRVAAAASGGGSNSNNNHFTHSSSSAAATTTMTTTTTTSTTTSGSHPDRPQTLSDVLNGLAALNTSKGPPKAPATMSSPNPVRVPKASGHKGSGGSHGHATSTGNGSGGGSGGVNGSGNGGGGASTSVTAAASSADVAASQTGNYRASQYWMALYNLRLLFYQFHGDIEPRYSLDVSDVHVILSKDRGRTYSMVSLQFNDGRLWHLEFNDRKSAVFFDIAVHESKKALRDNNSIYMRQDDFSDDVSIGFR